MDAATLAAIDEGTMSSRALVFDGSGRPRAARATGTHPILPGTRLDESQPRDDRRHCGSAFVARRWPQRETKARL